MLDTLDEPLVFTIGDLTAQNIIVNDGKFVGAVGFQRAGFYPPFFAYVSARWRFVKRQHKHPADAAVVAALVPHKKAFKMCTTWLHYSHRQPGIAIAIHHRCEAPAYGEACEV